MTKRKSPYLVVLGARITVNVEPIAARIISDHASLLAEGYRLKTPVTVSVRKDGRVTIPLIYARRRQGGWSRVGEKISVYAGALFGVGPEAGA